jgi:cytochrome c oxidase assembly protein subunit 15
LIRQRLAVTPDQFRKVAYLALIALSLIVVTGAAVRLTGSGLGCPTWPKCYGKIYPPITTHALIEFGNRALSGLVGVVCVVVAVLAFTRRPFRRDLAWLAVSLPLGVVAQAVLGGFTVREHLAPGFVMSHFLLSMLILVFAFALAWRATFEPGARPRATDRVGVWAVRALVPLGALTIFAGTASTAAGPHSGGMVGQTIRRLTFKGPDTLKWMVQQHGTAAVLLGVTVIAVWLYYRRRGAPSSIMDPLTALGVLMAAQGLVGAVQYELQLPADMVWVHVSLATATWLTILWSAAAAGRLAPRTGAGGDPAARDPAARDAAIAPDPVPDGAVRAPTGGRSRSVVR